MNRQIGPGKYRSCSVKKKYSEDAAKRAAIAVNLSNGKHFTVENVVAYKCGYCQFWHVGHERKPPRTGHPNQRRIKKMR